MADRYVVHHHQTGKSHYDLRISHDKVLRSWSLLREPPQKKGERRLAIERESFEAQAVNCTRFEEEAFGVGDVRIWDQGVVNLVDATSRRIVLELQGARLTGRYELKRMLWYPGNRWLLQKW